MVVRGCLGDVRDDSAADYGAVGETLGEEPGEVDGCVDADGGEGGAAVAVARDFGFGEDAELVMSASILMMGRRRLACGTTSLNHASSLISSANQSPMAVPTSFVLRYRTVSAEDVRLRGEG